MKAVVRSIILVVALILGVTGCSAGKEREPETDKTLSIEAVTYSSWDGSSRTENFTMPAKVGETIDLPILGSPEVVFTITRVSGDTVTFTSSELLWPTGSPNWSIEELRTEFEVTKGTPLKIETMTEDAGTGYTIELSDSTS